MVLVQILKRRDAASLVVAIVLALIVSQLIGQLTGALAAQISGLGDGQPASFAMPGSGWQSQYLQPVVWASLQLLALELLVRLYTAGRTLQKKRK